MRVTGPVGREIELRDEYKNLAKVAEIALKRRSGLCAFIVTCGQDEKLLRELMKRMPAKSKSSALPPLNAPGQLAVHIRKQEARLQPQVSSTGHPTLLGVLSTAPEAVHNVLIDQHQAERILLFDDLEVAKTAVWDPRLASKSPVAYALKKGTDEASSTPPESSATALAADAPAIRAA